MIDLDALEENARGYPVVSLHPLELRALVSAVRAALEADSQMAGVPLFTKTRKKLRTALAPFRI